MILTMLVTYITIILFGFDNIEFNNGFGTFFHVLDSQVGRILKLLYVDFKI